MSARSELTPQMLAYAEKFADSGDIRWLPYLAYFHPNNHRSAVVNTDSAGFRYSHRGTHRYSVADLADTEAVRLIVGSSTVFGIGASSDEWTLASRLSARDERPEPWVNFGGRSFNSTQEMLLMMLYRHQLPKVEEIVLFSGFNNLGLARMPESRREDHGTFFMYHEFYDAFADRDRSAKATRKALRRRKPEPADTTPSMAEQLRYAADLTARHLDVWRVLAHDWGAKLTYFLQPLSRWVREQGTAQEEALFAELDAIGRFSETYGDILDPAVCLEYAALLGKRATGMGVDFVNMSPILADALAADQWLFVDRIHFTDSGHDFVAGKILDTINGQ